MCLAYDANIWYRSIIMPFVKQETIDNLETRATDAERENSLMRGQLATALTIIGEDGKDGVAARALRRVEELKQSGALDARALDGVVVELQIEESKRYEDSLIDSLKEKHRADVAKRIRINEGPQIRAKLDELFSTDGTYDAIDEEIETAVRTEITEVLLTEHREKLEAEMSTPEAKEELIASLVAEMRADGTYDRIKREVKTEIQKQWDEEARQELKDEITAEESTGEEAFKEEKKKALRGSVAYKNTRSAIRKSIRAKWAEDANDCLAEDAKSEELAKLVAERIALEKTRIKEVQTSINADKLKNEFYGSGGFDMDSLSEGTRVTVYLGEVTKGRLRVSERNANFIGRGDVNRIDREITMIATADKGHFCVVSDSLSESDSIYEQKAAIVPDTVVAVGRKLIKYGAEEFQHTIAAGVRMVYDTNTNDSDFNDTYLTVVDLQIGDARASERPNEPANSKAFRGLAQGI